MEPSCLHVVVLKAEAKSYCLRMHGKNLADTGKAKRLAFHALAYQGHIDALLVHKYSDFAFG